MWERVLSDRLVARYGHPVALLQIGGHGRKNTILFFAFRPGAGRPFLVGRLNTSDSTTLRKEAEARASTYQRLTPSLQEAVPKAAFEAFDQAACLFEPFLEGKHLPIPRNLCDLASYGNLSMPWLRAFQDATLAPWAPAGSLVRRAEQTLVRSAEVLTDPTIRAWLHGRRQDLGCLELETPCSSHGDYWPGNLLRQNGALRVIDWEYLDPIGNPFFDPVLNLVSLAIDDSGRDPTGWFDQAFLQPSPIARLSGKFLDRFRRGHDHRSACSVTAILVVLELILRHVDSRRRVAESPHYPLLQRLVREPDPVGSIRKALWPDPIQGAGTNNPPGT